MFATSSNLDKATSHLAAQLTDRALEILAAAGTRGVSVDAELWLWRGFQLELDRQFRQARGGAALRAEALRI